MGRNFSTKMLGDYLKKLEIYAFFFFGTLWAKKSGCIIIHILEFKGLILTSLTYELTLIVSSRSIVKQRLVGWAKRLVEELILRGGCTLLYWDQILFFIF